MSTTRVILGFAALSHVVPAYADDEPRPPSIATDGSLAINYPDEFAWKLFVEISRPAAGNKGFAGWETWADQEHIYADPNITPRWPSEPISRKRLSAPIQQVDRLTGAELPPIPPDENPLSGLEEVHDNHVAFRYIVDNQLWYTQGLIAKAQSPGGIKFPEAAIVIKARWKFIEEDQKPRFHWHEYELGGQPAIVGLTALHVSSKALPNWHWATFEQVDNPGLADYIGVHDSYGLNPSIIYPNPTPNQGYKGGKLRRRVTELMKQAGLGPQWAHYRLKGAQVDFTDSTGRPTLNGNSITEQGFVSTASCITCHSRSTIKAPSNGAPNAPGALSVFNGEGQSFNGPVRSAWFWVGAPDAKVVNRPEAKYYQLDFLWQLGFFSKQRTQTPGS